MAEDDTKNQELGNWEDDNKSYFQFMEGHPAGKRGVNPTSADAFQVQADYLKELGDKQHPFDVLRRISLNPWCSPRDRISAAKTLLEYSMAKMPGKIEVSGPAGGAIQIDQSQLKNLSTQELDQLIKLLDKSTGIEG